MKMNKILVLLSVVALTLAGCAKEEFPGANTSASDGRVTFEVGFAIPGAGPSTKAMVNDPADIEIKNIYIAVFTYRNYLKEFVKAIPLTAGGEMNLDGDGNYKYEKVGGLYKVRFSLEETTSERHVHVLANVPESITPPDFDYLDKVLGENLYCADTQDGYWRYVHFADGTGISASSASAFDGLKLVRNYAQISLATDSGCGYSVVGFELYNIPTRGSFLPYKGSNTFCDNWETSSAATTYSSLLASYPGYLIPGSTPLYKPSYGASDFPNSTASKFMYEHPASEENPTYIMAKLHDTSDSDPDSYKFYRLDILDEDGYKSAIIRNYHYTVTIHSISTGGAATPAEAELTPSDYNFTLSKETESVDAIYSNGAYMETNYVEKVFTKAANDQIFRYRYTEDMGASTVVYSPGELSDITGGGEVTPQWSAGASGTSETGGWYSVKYNVGDPSTIGGDELESTFTVTAGSASTMIVRKVSIFSMKPKTLDVSVWAFNTSSNKQLDMTLTIPGGLRPSMFPLHLQFQMDKDPAADKQILSPQTPGLVVVYDDDSKVIFQKDIYYSDYDPTTGAVVDLDFESPIALSVPPVLHITDTDGYFVPQDLGQSYAAGLYADPIAKGGLHTTVLEFNYTADTNVPITLNLTDLEIDPDFTPVGGTLSGNVFTPSGKGAKRIGLRATSSNVSSDGEVTMHATVSGLPDPAALTVKRYSQYVTGALVQNGDLPLGEGSTTTVSFNYTARDMLPITITAPQLEIWSADGSTLLGDGSCVYTPSAKGPQSITIKSKSHFASAGSVSFSVPNMTNPASLAIKRATTFVIPAGALNVHRKAVLGVTPDFHAPVYWRTNKRRNTSNTLGLSNYFNSTENTGNITIDISKLSSPGNSTRLYFMYVYTSYLGILPIDNYMYAQATLKQLIEATPSSPYTLNFELY